MKKILIALVLLLTSCNTTLDQFVVTKSAKEKEIAALRVDYETKIKEKEIQVSNSKDSIIVSKDAQMQASADAFYAQDVLFNTLPDPKKRTDLVWHNYGIEGWTALGHIMPTYQKMQEINERLKKDLDETKTSLIDLENTHKQIVAENNKLNDKTDELKKQLKTLEDEKSLVTETFNNALRLKQEELNISNDQLISAQNKKLENDKEIKAAKMKISIIAGMLGLLGIAGAIYIPFAKEKLGIFGAVMFLVSVGIWYITPFIVASCASVLIALLVGWTLYKYNLEHKSATGVYRAIQSIKDKSSEEYNKIIKPELTVWLSKYDKEGNLIPDRKIEDHIDSRLMEVGDK